jgi:hypothetical protein
MWSVSHVDSQAANGNSGQSEIKHHLVDIAPSPILTRLKRLHNRMLGPVKVLGRVLILRRVAATDVTARHAHPQMDPVVARF